MKVSESVSMVKIPFRIPASGGRYTERSVNSFLIAGKVLCLVDAGVAGTTDALLRMATDAGRDPGEISLLVLSHSHPDHIGGALAIQRATGCLVAAHPAEAAWIEDTSRQARERPIPGFTTLVEGSMKVDRLLGNGDRIGIGDDRYLSIIHTLGHSPGSISLFLDDEGVLITGDAIPVTGEIPVYDDPASSVRSIGKLEELRGVKLLLSSWDTPKTGDGIRQAMANGKETIRSLQAAVVRASEGETDPTMITRKVVADLGLPDAALPVIGRTVEGHIRALKRGEVI